MGSLINGQFGASGLEYRRNRYYDPQQGRFTQEDPIGLAGGLNLYGFAGGDPVNFSDPFGLCVPMPWCLALAGGGSVATAASLSGAGAIGAVAGAAPVVGLGVIGGVLLRPAFAGAGMVTTGRGVGTWASESTGAGAVPDLPSGLTGENPRDGTGKRINTDLTGGADEVFDRLTGGHSRTLPDGTKVEPNGVRLRPGTENSGPRVDIPAKGQRPHETIHFPVPDHL